MTTHYLSTRPLAPRRVRAVRRAPRAGVRVLPRWVECVLARWVKWTNYQAYLDSLAWRSKRERALRRAEFACQLCNAKKGKGVWLEVHHRDLTYSFEFGCEDDNDLTVLCNRCHGRFHGK